MELGSTKLNQKGKVSQRQVVLFSNSQAAMEGLPKLRM